jgi:hypothetical protein
VCPDSAHPRNGYEYTRNLNAGKMFNFRQRGISMLSKERSFNRLCRLITEAPDNDETAAEINSLMNDLYSQYSDLRILRALAGRFVRAGAYAQSARGVRHRSVH